MQKAKSSSRYKSVLRSLSVLTGMFTGALLLSACGMANSSAKGSIRSGSSAGLTASATGVSIGQCVNYGYSVNKGGVSVQSFTVANARCTMDGKLVVDYQNFSMANCQGQVVLTEESVEGSCQ